MQNMTEKVVNSLLNAIQYIIGIKKFSYTCNINRRKIKEKKVVERERKRRQGKKIQEVK